MADTDTLDWQTPGFLASTTPPPAPPAAKPQANPFDEFDASPSPQKTTPDMGIRVADNTPSKNPFDEFDEPSQIEPRASSDATLRSPDTSAATANPFDAFDDPAPLQEPKPVEGPVSIGTIKYDPFAYLVPGGPAAAQSGINEANQHWYNFVGNAVEWGGGLLRQFGNANWMQPWAPNQNSLIDPNTDPYIQAGIKIKQYASNFPVDPNFSFTNKIAGVIGDVLPMAATAPFQGVTKAIGGLMLGSQTYDTALSKGSGEDLASLVSAPAAALGVISPLSRVLKISPSVASAGWNQLFKNIVTGASIAGGKNLVEMSGVNAATNEMVNAVSLPDQQESQTSVITRSIMDSLIMAFVGSALHLGEQATAEHNVNQVAKQQGMAKSELIGNTANFYQNLATNDALTPQQKMAASTEYLSQFSPHAAQTLVAHVQNVGQAVDSIKAAIAASKDIAPTNPETAEALQKEQTAQAIATAQENAKTIEQQADEAEKALPPELAPEEPQKTEEQPKPQESPAAQESAPDVAETPKPAIPIEGAMPDDEYKATQSKLASSEDSDVAARAKQLADERQALLDERASTDSDTKKADIENQIKANDEALLNLEQEPVAPKQEAPVAEQTKPREVLDYDAYGNPVYAPEPEVSTEKPNVETKTEAEPAPTTVSEVKPPEEKAVESPVPAEQGSVEKSGGIAPMAEQPSTEVSQPKVAEDISKLKRPQLEKIAADEGHTPEDVKGAKGVKELRDLIEAKRIAQEPATDRDKGLVQDGKAKIDPKINRLASKYSDPVKAFVKAAKAYGLRGVTKFLVGDESHDAAFYADPRSGHFDTVYINPIKVAKEMAYLKNQKLSPTEINHYLKTVFREEFIHAQVGNILNKRWMEAGKPGSFEQYYDKNYQAIYDKMSKAEKKETIEDYGGGLSHPVNIGEEFLRKTVQVALGGEATEALNAKVRSRLKTNKPLRNLLQDLTDRFKGISKKLVGLGKPDAELDVITNKLESLLGGKIAPESNETKELPSKPASPQLNGGEYMSADDIAKNIEKHLAEERARVEANRHGNSAGTVRQSDKDIQRDSKTYDLLRKNGVSSPEQFSQGIGHVFRSDGLAKRADVLKAAAESGRLISPKEIANLDPNEIAGGAEHKVYLIPSEDKIIKITRPGRYGLSGSLKDYLKRMEDQNTLSPGLGIGIMGITPDKATGFPQVVTQMRNIEGLEPSPKELHDALINRYGFKADGSLGSYHYTHPDGVEIFDAHSGNILKVPSGDMTAAEKAKILARPHLYPNTKWDYVPVDIGIRGDPSKPIFVPESKEPKVAGASKLEPTEDDEHDLYFGGNEGLKERAPYVPSKSEEEASKLKPFLELGESGELKPTGNERLRSERLVPEQGQEKEQTLANRIESLKSIEVSPDDQVRFKTMAETQAKLQFSNDANRDIAEGNAFVKALIESKKWIEKNGSLEGFGARRIIQNSLLDDARRLAKGENISTPTEEPEKSPTSTDEEGEESQLKPKGYDPTEQDYEAQQSQFELVGNEGGIPSHLETPAKKAQDAIVEKNIRDVTSSFSPYGKRLLELWSDTPDQEGSAFPAWVNAAAKEFGVSRAKIMSDKDAIDSKVRQEVEARGLTPDDFRRVAGAPKLDSGERQRGFNNQLTNDSRLRDDIRSLVLNYSQKPNPESNREANEIILRDGEHDAYSKALGNILHGKPSAVDSFIFQKINQKMLASEIASIRVKGIEDHTSVAIELTKSGQFSQAFRAWSKLGSDGALLAYDKMIRPVIDKAKEPFKGTTDALENAVKEGKQQAIDQTIDRMTQNGVFEKAEKLAAKNKEEEKPIWQRYMERTAEALSQTADAKTSPVIKAALQEFSQRMQSNLKSLIAEKVKTPETKKATPMSADAKIREIYNNEPEYREAWEYAKTYIDAKYAEHPEILAQYQKALDSALAIPVKLLDKSLADSMKASGVKIADLAKEWAGKQNVTKNQLIDDLKMRIGLNGDQAKALGDAIAARFHQKLNDAKKAELTKLIRGSGNNRLATEAPSLADKIIKAVNLGLPEDQAVWNALADKLKLPKYNDAVAADLAKRANEIQKMIADGKEGKLTDDKTQEMLDVLADEAQKNMGKWQQFGQGMMAVFYGNIFGPLTVARKTVSEVTNLVAEVGTRATVEMRHGDALAIPRAYTAALRGLYNRGGADFRSILATGKGARQGHGGDYTSNNLAERGKIFGNIPGLSLLNKPLSLYKYVGRALYGAQAFFYAGSAEARATMVSYRIAKQLIREGKNPDELTVNQLTQQILGNTPEMRAQYAKQAQEEGLTGRDAVMRIQELAEGQRPEDARLAAHDFASRATFMHEPEGFTGAMYKRLSSLQREYPATRILVPVARVVSNVFNNFLSYTPAGTFGAIRLAKAGDTDAALQQGAKMVVGALSTIAFASLFGPNIQGSGPKDYNKRKQLMEPKTGNGWIPYSIKVGNNYYSYREWPTALMMAGLGNYFDQAKYGETAPDLPQRLAVAMTGTSRFALTSSWISSVNNILQMADSSSPEEFENSFKNFAGQTGSALVPFNQKTIQMMDQIFDPQKYSPNDISGILLSRVPVAREMTGGKPSLNVFGEPIESNPIQSLMGLGTTDSFYSQFSSTRTFLPAVTKTEHINGRAITTDELYQLTKQAGQATKEILQDGGLDAMSSMTQEEAQDYVSRIYRAEVMKSKYEISLEAPDAGHGNKSSKHHR